MRIIIEIWEIGLAIALMPFWTKWYLPINVSLTKYILSGELTISFFWLLHFSVRFPYSKVNTDLAKQYVRK